MIAIVSYGVGNINSFANVYKRLNMPITIAAQKEELKNASKIILPGVGAFDHAMTLLQKSGMIETLEELVLQKNIPVLGICVGMQMLSRSSEEGTLPGLGWIDGTVRKFEFSMAHQKTRLPHMGWNTITPTKEERLLESFNESSRFYFLHSYYFHCFNPENELSRTEYGLSFTSAIKSGNIYGVQFHPEKSHGNGIQLLKNFANL